MELVGNQNPGHEASPQSQRGGSKRDARREATARRAIEKSRYVRVIEEVTRDDPIEYFLPTNVQSAL